MGISLAGVNWIAVIVAVVTNMLAGALWYSPVLFAKQWMAEVKMTKEQIRSNSNAAYKGYAISIVASIVIALSLAVLVGATGVTGAAGAITLGLLVSVGFVATAVAANFSFEQKTLRHYLITVGYSVVGTLLMSLIITL